jgi:hypothetical protein
MANEKLWVASIDGRSLPKPADENRTKPDRSGPAPQGPQPEEGLRLISAFSRINDPARRAELIAQAEKFSGPM